MATEPASKRQRVLTGYHVVSNSEGDQVFWQKRGELRNEAKQRALEYADGLLSQSQPEMVTMYVTTKDL